MQHLITQKSHMPIVSAICSHGLWLLFLILLISGYFWFKTILSLHRNSFRLQRFFGESIILIQLFRFITGISGILGLRFCITYGIPFLGFDLRDWLLDAVLTGLLLAVSIRSTSLFPREVYGVKSRCSHPLQKQES